MVEEEEVKAWVLLTCMDVCSAYDATAIRSVPNNRQETLCICYDGDGYFPASTSIDTRCEVDYYPSYRSSDNTFSE